MRWPPPETGLLTKPQVIGGADEAFGNAIYGQYGQDFTSRDGVAFMVVLLTGRHFRDLVEVTGTGAAVAALADALGADFAAEGDRYRYRDVLSGLFATWFGDHAADEVTAALSGTTVLFERYRTLAEVVQGPKVTANPLFSSLHQPGLGDYLAPAMPAAFDGAHPASGPARAGTRHCRRPHRELGIDRRRHRAFDERQDDRLWEPAGPKREVDRA